MKINRIMLPLLAIALLTLNSCEDSKSKKTKGGTSYQMLREGEGELAKDGEYLMVNLLMKTKINGEDSVIDDSNRGGTWLPMLRIDSIWAKDENGVNGVMAEMKKGDSVVFEVPITKLIPEGRPIPAPFDTTTSFTFNVGVAEIMNQEAYGEWTNALYEKRRKEQEETSKVQLDKDIQIIDDYLAENNIDAQKSDSGLRYVITEEGTGEVAQSGDKVKVNYAGKVLSGAYFDTNIKEIAEANDMNRPAFEPFEFTLGQGSVIKGWDEGIGYLSKGAKATLYIPSTLAYGPSQRSEVIVPNSILEFDVELLDIVKDDAQKTQ